MDEIKRKVYLDLFATPGTLLPVAAGLTAWIASWAMGGDAVMNFAGLAGVLTGAGVLASRLILGLDRITHNAYNHVLQRQRRLQEESLEQLEKRLSEGQDARTLNCLRELRHLYSRLQTEIEQRKVNAAEYGVIEGVEQLFHGCIQQLEHTAGLWETAATMKGPARQDLLRQREELVREVCDAVVHLGQTVERFHAVTTQKNRRELTRLRKELDQSMQVAREAARRTEQLIEQQPVDSRELE
jgi:hypothetical protein